MLRFILPGLMLLISSYTDIKEGVIYSEVAAVSAVCGLICGFLPGGPSWPDMLAGAVLGALIISASLVTRGEIGMGDGILFTVTGLYLGFGLNLTLLMFSLLLSSVYSMVLVISGRARRGLKSEYPFSPFVFLAFVLVTAAEVFGCFGVG